MTMDKILENYPGINVIVSCTMSGAFEVELAIREINNDKHLPVKFIGETGRDDLLGDAVVDAFRKNWKLLEKMKKNRATVGPVSIF